MKDGIYHGIDEIAYHSDPALSYSACKQILANPERWKWQREQGRRERKAFDIGHAAHAKVLGVGLDIAVIPADILASNGATSTKAAKEFVDEARKRGAVPIKQDEADRIDAMAEKVLTHPLARDIFTHQHGEAEVSMWWTDPETGAACRGRMDWFIEPEQGTIADYKTADSAAPHLFGASAWRYGYLIQAWSYSNAISLLLGGDLPPFYMVAQETEPPYSVAVYRPEVAELEIGRRLYRKAIETYLRCTETGIWPAYGDGVMPLQLPAYAYNTPDNTEDI